MFYGEKFLDLFHKILLPSLWLPGNIPALLHNDFDVSHRIYCPRPECEALTHYALNSEIKVEFNDNILSTNHEAARHEGLYRCLQHHIHRGTLTVFAPCDHVFGEGLYRVIKDIQPGEYLVCGHPRIDYENGLEAVAAFLETPHSTNNRELVWLCMNSIPHPMVVHGKTNRETYWRTIRQGDHWETYFAEPPPVAFWSVPDFFDAWRKPTLHADWEVIDHDLPNHCYKRGRLKLVTDSREFFWAEFTSNRQYVPTLYTRLELESLFYCHTIPLRWYD